jgi:hypothetical protein
MSDQEVLVEAAEDYENVDDVVRAVRTQISAAIAGLGKDRLAEARAAVSGQSQERVDTPLDPAEAQKRVAEILASETSRSRMTWAARNDQGSSESDILSAFADLCELDGSKRVIRKIDFGSAPKAERILQELGVTEPQEIDVEAIAWHLGARVKFSNLCQCEARIVGTDDVAIITVSNKSSEQRQRFSICHELGHWIYHRRRMLLCQSEEIERPSADSMSAERVADRFAAELLMPSYLFAPIARSLGRPSMSVVRKLAKLFNTSQTATAIRLVEISELPLLLADYGKSGRRWFARSLPVSNKWMPNIEVSPESCAFDMIYGNAPGILPPRSGSASRWFSRDDASRFEVVEDSLRVTANEVLTLLAFKNSHEFMQYSKQ